MSPIVKCDICGQICNESYLNAHKRLAHKKEQTVAPATHAEPETVKAILQMFGQLSDRGQEIVRAYLLPGFEAGRASNKTIRDWRETKPRIQ